MSLKKCILFSLLAGLLVLVLLGTCGMLWVYGYFDDFPTHAEMDQFFLDYRTINGDLSKQQFLLTFLLRTKNPQSSDDDREVMYFLDKLKAEHLAAEDENILAAVDQLPINGGFAELISGFCYSLKDTETFRRRYRNNTEPLTRYVGLSFSEEDLDTIRKGFGAFSH